MKKLSNYANLLNSSFWKRIAETVDIPEASLGIFRWICGFFLLLFLTPRFDKLFNSPDAFFNPPLLSLVNLLNGFPPVLFFTVLDVLIVLCIFFLTVGIRARISGFCLLAFWIIGNNFRYSFGKIDHGTILVLALLLCLSFSGWGHYYALVPDPLPSPKASKKSLAVFAVLVVFGMFTAGFEKALNWVDFDFSTNGFLSWFYPGYYEKGRTSFLAPVVLILPKWIFEFVDYTAVFFELSGFIALLHSRRWWLTWLLFACFFHLANGLLLNIAFNGHFLVYLVFINFHYYGRQVANFLGNFISGKLKYFLLGCVTSLSLAHLLPKLNWNHLDFLVSYNNLSVSIFLWIIAVAIVSVELLVIPSNRQSTVNKY